MAANPLTEEAAVRLEMKKLSRQYDLAVQKGDTAAQRDLEGRLFELYSYSGGTSGPNARKRSRNRNS